MSITEAVQTVPAGIWKSDPVHSSVGFSVQHMGVNPFRGTLSDFQAVLGGEQLVGSASVESIATPDENLTAHLLSPDFLEAEKYPEIRFHSTSIEPTAEDVFRVRGELIVKETPFEIELETRVRGLGHGQLGDERIVLDARGAFEWGTTTVELTIAVSAAKEA